MIGSRRQHLVTKLQKLLFPVRQQFSTTKKVGLQSLKTSIFLKNCPLESSSDNCPYKNSPLYKLFFNNCPMDNCPLDNSALDKYSLDNCRLDNFPLSNSLINEKCIRFYDRNLVIDDLTIRPWLEVNNI